MSETRKAFEALQGIGARHLSGRPSAPTEGTPCLGPSGGPAGQPVSGRRVRFGGSNQPSGMSASFPPGFDLKVEPYRLGAHEGWSNASGNHAPAAVVVQERCPHLDVYDEPDHILVLADLPGVDPDTVEVLLSHDMLELSASGAHRRYRAELLLPQPFEPEALSHHLRRDLLSIRLQR